MDLSNNMMPSSDAGKHVAGDQASWKNSRSFVLKLGCVTADGAMADVGGMVSTSISLSKEYSITGFQDGDAAGLQCLFAVNSSFLLALDAEAIGRVFGMEFEGEVVERTVNREKRIEVIQLMAKAHKAVQSGRVFFDSFRSMDLRTYVRRRKEQLHLIDADKATLSWSFAYSLQHEFFEGARYNWADFKVKHLTNALKTRRTSRDVRSFLAQYIAAVAPSVQEAYEGLKIVGGVRAAVPETPDSDAARRTTRQCAKPKRPRVLEPACAEDQRG